MSTTTTSNTFTGHSSTDTILRSSDGVLFPVNQKTLIDVSHNAFGGRLASGVHKDAAVNIPLDSSRLSVILCAICNITPNSQGSRPPSFEASEAAIAYMHHDLGVSPSSVIRATSAIQNHLYSFAPDHAMDLYMLAGHFGLEDLAVQTSQHLLHLDLRVITDEMTERMGVIYFKRLFLLHLFRKNELKVILRSPPPLHAGPEHAQCVFDSFFEWTSATNLTIFNVGEADLTPHALGQSLNETLDIPGIPCARCRTKFGESVAQALLRWSQVKTTI